MTEKQDKELTSEDFDNPSFGKDTFADQESRITTGQNAEETNQFQEDSYKQSVTMGEDIVEETPSNKAQNADSAESEEEEDFDIDKAQAFESGYKNLNRLKQEDEDAVKPLPELGKVPMDQISDDPFDEAMELVKKGETGALVDNFDPYDDKYKANLESLLNIKFDFILEIGRARMKISDILLLGQGSVIELNKLVGEELNIMVNDKWVARGEIVICRERFGTRITHILSQEERLKKLSTAF